MYECCTDLSYSYTRIFFNEIKYTVFPLLFNTLVSNVNTQIFARKNLIFNKVQQNIDQFFSDFVVRGHYDFPFDLHLENHFMVIRFELRGVNVETIEQISNLIFFKFPAWL